MASIIKTSINLNEIPKDKIINGKKGKYLPISITINDEPDQFGNQGPVIVEQTKEERDAKTAKTYLGNVKVVSAVIVVGAAIDKYFASLTFLPSVKRISPFLSLSPTTTGPVNAVVFSAIILSP